MVRDMYHIEDIIMTDSIAYSVKPIKVLDDIFGNFLLN